VPQVLIIDQFEELFKFNPGILEKLNKNDKGKVLHPIIYRIIPATPLLLIGYRLGSIAYEILFRSICAESQLYNILVLPQLSSSK
jgi:hypothetical protein